RPGHDQRRGGRTLAVRRADPRPHPADADARRRVPRAHRLAHPARREPRGGRVMISTLTTTAPAKPIERSQVRARPAGFVADVAAIAGRALRAVPPDLDAVITAVVIWPVLFLL